MYKEISNVQCIASFPYLRILTCNPQYPGLDLLFALFTVVRK